MKVYIEAVEESLMPAYAHSGDAGMDVRAAQDVDIAPGETKIVSIGIKMAMPEGIMCDVRPRSGLSAKTPLRVANAPGTVDSGYRDTIGVIVTNTSPSYEFMESEEGLAIMKNDAVFGIDEKGNKHGIYRIKKGDRIAQIVFSEYVKPELEAADISEIDGDRGGGFGHSGVK